MKRRRMCGLSSLCSRMKRSGRPFPLKQASSAFTLSLAQVNRHSALRLLRLTEDIYNAHSENLEGLRVDCLTLALAILWAFAGRMATGFQLMNGKARTLYSLPAA